MKVVWDTEAQIRLRHTAAYIGKNFGRVTMREFLRDVRNTTGLLRENPALGRIEPLLQEMPLTYRSIVLGRLNKSSIMWRVK